MLLLLALIGGLAHAQDGLNAHGFYLVPTDGDKLDFLGTWRPERQVAGSFGITGLFEYADSPLVLVRREGDTLVRDPLVDNLLGLNLGLSFAAHERVAVALTAPVYFLSAGQDGTDGPAFGDLRLSVPVGLVLPGEDGGFGLSVVPFLDLPTGATGRFLGNQGIAGGGLLAAGYSGPRYATSLNVGYRATPSIDYENLRGGGKLLLAAAVGYELTEWLGARAEVIYTPGLTGRPEGISEDTPPSAESPSETLVSLRGRYDSGLSWTGGLALPLNRGAGAAAFRLFAGMGYTVGKKVAPELDSDGDGLVDSLDACPDAPETVNGWKDDDGCPDALADMTFTILNEDGEPVTDAAVLLDGELMQTDAQGRITLSGRMPESQLSFIVSHPHYVDADPVDVTLAEGDNTRTLKLDYLPGKVRVITKSNTGKILDARVRFEGPKPRDPENVGPEGTKVFDLRPGKWMVLVSADAFGTERRELEINPGETSLVVIEVILYPTKTEIKATEIRILEQVNFDFDKATVKAESLPLLREISNVLIDHPEIVKIEVQGHTDNKGRAAYNRELSQRRVEAVVTYLVEQGVAADRLVAKGYGMDKPLVPNTSESNRAKNRRVQFVILEPSASEGVQVAPDGGAK